MKHLFLPSLCAALLAGCSPGERMAQAETAGTNATTGPTTPPPASVVTGTSPSASNTPVTKPPAATAIATNPSPAVPVASLPLVAPKPPPELPGPAQEVVRLAQTTVDPTVIISYIESLQQPFTLNADQIIYLSDLGLGNPVINALVKRANNSGTPTAAIQNVVVNAAAAPNPAAAANPAPEPVAPGANNVLLTNYLASTAGGLPAGIPGAPMAAAPAPVYGQPQPGPETIAAQPVPVAVQQPVSTTVFYESLSPYGNWVRVEPYGWCWQPTIVSVTPSWRPYCDGGQWAWTDHGWYWHSTYSWGWAPFHYGRWHRSASIGWVWAPGCDWGPAWVSWRYNDAHCGWAPLPPECHWSAGVGFSWSSRGTRVSIGFGLVDDCWYATSWNRFCDPGLPRWCLDRREVPRFVNNSQHAIGGDNSVNIVGNNNTVIINNGIPADEVQRRGRQEVRKYAVSDAANPNQSATRLQAAGSSARPEIAAYRPRIDAATGRESAPPPTILARQEARKSGASSPSASSGIVPARPGSDGSRSTVGNAALTPGRPPGALGRPSPSNGSSPGSGKAAEPSTRPGNLADRNPTPSVGGGLPARNSANSTAPSSTIPSTAPARPQPSLRESPRITGNPTSSGEISRPTVGTAPARPTGSTPAAGSSQPTTGATAPARPAANPLTGPTYSQPAYSSPAARPAPVSQIRQAPQAPQAPVQTPTVRQDIRAIQQVPTARTEIRKPEPSYRATPYAMDSGIAGGGRAANPSSPVPSPSYQGSGRSTPSYSPQPAPRASAPTPVMRSQPEVSAPSRPSAPQPSFQSAPQGRSYPAAPQQGGGARPSLSRGQNPVE
jgi:hypothetical protein